MTTPEFTLLVDGDCPLCRHEANLLRRLDRGRNRLAIVDIAAPGFDPADYDRTHDQLMAEIHGVSDTGETVTGMEAFRRAYRAVGLGWLFTPTAWPGLRPLFDAAYRWFARHRLRLTGRAHCDTGRCDIHPSNRKTNPDTQPAPDATAPQPAASPGATR